MLKAGTYSINDNNVTLNGDYVINYNINQLISLSNKYVEWSTKTTLAVSDGLALNVDPSNLSDGTWSGVTRHGDVEYDKQSKALLFNENEETNPTGEGGYLEYNKQGLDFSNGFTFEYYFNTSRGQYMNDSGHSSIGFFLKIPSLDTTFTNALRFCWNEPGNDIISSFFGTSKYSYSSDDSNFSTSTGRIYYKGTFIENDKDTYLTCVYTVYDPNKQNENYDDYMKENNVDKVEYYINGNLLGKTYYDNLTYQNGLNVWNNDEAPLFVGVALGWSNSNLYYMKGKVYTCRLYEMSMTPKQVKDNVDMTQKYISSF